MVSVKKQYDLSKDTSKPLPGVTTYAIAGNLETLGYPPFWYEKGKQIASSKMFTLQIYKICTLGGDSEYFHPIGERILPFTNVTALIASTL